MNDAERAKEMFERIQQRQIELDALRPKVFPEVLRNRKEERVQRRNYRDFCRRCEKSFGQIKAPALSILQKVNSEIFSGRAVVDSWKRTEYGEHSHLSGYGEVNDRDIGRHIVESWYYHKSSQLDVRITIPEVGRVVISAPIWSMEKTRKVNVPKAEISVVYFSFGLHQVRNKLKELEDIERKWVDQGLHTCGHFGVKIRIVDEPLDQIIVNIHEVIIQKTVGLLETHDLVASDRYPSKRTTFL